MIFGKGKTFKLQYYKTSTWNDFHTVSTPITVNYSKCRSIVSTESIIEWGGSNVKESSAILNTNKVFIIDFIVKYYDEDVVGGVVNGVTVRGVSYLHTEVIANGEYNYIRIYPDLDNAPSKYYDVNIVSLKKSSFEETTYALYRLELEARDQTTTLI